MMNMNDEIQINTKVYGFLGEYAQQNRFSVTMNTFFKSQATNAMMIPMNIRADDFYYTVSGLRHAKLNGVVIDKEYRHQAVDLCDHCSDDVLACGFCDVIRVHNGLLYGDVAIGRALAMLLEHYEIGTLALYGSGALAKALLLHVQQSALKKITLYHDRVESCMHLARAFNGALEGLEVDIVRANHEMIADFSKHDMAINCVDESTLFSPVTPSHMMVDVSDENGAFSAVATGTYFGYDALLPYMNATVYTILLKDENEPG